MLEVPESELKGHAQTFESYVGQGKRKLADSGEDGEEVELSMFMQLYDLNILKVTVWDKTQNEEVGYRQIEWDVDAKVCRVKSMSINVDEDYQRKGVGTAMLKTIEELMCYVAQGRGCEKISFETDYLSCPHGIGFFEKHNYTLKKEVESLPGQPDGVGVISVKATKVLELTQ